MPNILGLFLDQPDHRAQSAGGPLHVDPHRRNARLGFENEIRREHAPDEGHAVWLVTRWILENQAEFRQRLGSHAGKERQQREVRIPDFERPEGRLHQLAIDPNLIRLREVIEQVESMRVVFDRVDCLVILADGVDDLIDVSQVHQQRADDRVLAHQNADIDVGPVGRVSSLPCQTSMRPAERASEQHPQNRRDCE